MKLKQRKVPVLADAVILVASKKFDMKQTKRKIDASKREAKRSEKIEAKRSERQRITNLLFSENEAKRKRNCFCFASFRFEAKKIRSENGTP